MRERLRFPAVPILTREVPPAVAVFDLKDLNALIDSMTLRSRNRKVFH